MNLFRFTVWKSTDLIEDFPRWSNTYVFDMDAAVDDLEGTARALAAAERAIHQNHVRFTHVVACKANGDAGDQYARDETTIIASEMTCRVFFIHSEFATGALPYNGEGWEQWALRVSFDRPGMRKGYKWYVGALGPADVNISPDGAVSVKDMYFWRAQVAEQYSFWFQYDASKHYVQRTGQNLDKFGEFTQCTAITVRGCNKTGAIASGKGKSFATWCAIGFVIGVFGPVVAAFMKEEKGDSKC